MEAAAIHRLLLTGALALATLFAPPARAVAGAWEFDGPGTASVPSGFARPGLPAWTADAEWTPGLAPVFLGLAAGGWSHTDPFGSAAPMWPAQTALAPPSAWADSVVVRMGGMGAGRGFGAPLLGVRSLAVRPLGRKARAVLTVLNGGSAVDRSSLLLDRGDERAWFRGGSFGARQGAIGSMDLAGEHLWFASGGTVRGDHETWGSYTQAGIGAQQALGGLREGGRSENGSAGWRWARGAREMSVELRRFHEGRDSRGNGIDFPESRRDAASEGAGLGIGDSLAIGRLALRVDAGRERVVRVTPSEDEPREEWKAAHVWASLTLARGWLGGDVLLALGGGRHDAAARAAERWQLAPSAEWEVRREGWSVRAHADRTVTPVSTDLAPGVAAFTQDVWLGGLEAEAGSRASHWASAGVAAGRVAQRATLLRYPLRDLALRIGWRHEEGGERLAILALAAGTRAGPLRFDARGSAQTRPSGTTQPRVDPALAARAGVEAAFALFTGDLQLRLRGEAAYVGERELESTAYSGVEPRRLPGYATLSLHARATLGDATLGVRVTNVEDARRPQVWIDPATGEPALGASRHLCFEIVWPLFD